MKDMQPFHLCSNLNMHSEFVLCILKRTFSYFTYLCLCHISTEEFTLSQQYYKTRDTKAYNL